MNKQCEAEIRWIIREFDNAWNNTELDYMIECCRLIRMLKEKYNYEKTTEKNND